MKAEIKGKVYLIGAGPGDPDLITVKGRECLQKADVIVYDYLVSESLVALGNREAEFIYVGKKSGRHTMRQGDINKLLIEKARAGLVVARLKGGDPFIFGRGAEEAMELSRAGIAFEIIPGVTSAIAVPAYAGIPLTHRDHASTVCFITGHEDPTKQESSINWDALANSQGTLVFLMGIGNLDKIAFELTQRGRPSHSPVAIIGSGTLPIQRTITGTLATISARAKDGNFKPPGIIVVGDVVNLRDHLNWFESRPLFGKRIVVTRPENQSEDFIRALSGLGAHCLPLPTIKIMAPPDWGCLDRAIDMLPEYDWILFTSINGVIHFFERLETGKKDARNLEGIKVGAIGAKTAEALVSKGVIPDLVPEKYWSEALVEALREHVLEGKRILLPRPAIARDYLPQELEALGAHVDQVEAYRTVEPALSQDQVDALFKEGTVDMITFSSPSTVENFLAMIRDKGFSREISKTAVACIGPITAQRAIERGLTVSVVPDEFTVEALTAAIVEYYRHR